MKKALLTFAGAAVAVLQSIAGPYIITGKVLYPDRSNAEGAKITIAPHEDTDIQAKSMDIGSDGLYSLAVGGYFEYTRLLDIKVEKAGYQTVLLSKVISRSFAVEDIILVPENVTIYKPYLNLIAQSASGENIVAWEREKDKDIKYYIVKRQNANGIYDSIGHVQYNAENSIFIDTEAGIEKTVFYQIEAVFNDGTKSLPSNPRKTFELSYLSAKLDKSLRLQFDFSVFDGIDYPANEISTVELQRSDNGRDFSVIGRKAIGEVTYETVGELIRPDTLRRAGTYHYRVAVNFSDTCYPSIYKSESGPFSQSLSNLAEAVILETDLGEEPVDPGTPVRALSDFSVSRVYPVPATNSFSVAADGKAHVAVKAVTGELVFDSWFENEISVPSRKLVAGIYFVTISSNGETSTYRQVVK